MARHYIPASQWKRSSKVSVSKKIGRKKKAERLAKAWTAKSKSFVTPSRPRAARKTRSS